MVEKHSCLLPSSSAVLNGCSLLLCNLWKHLSVQHFSQDKFNLSLLYNIIFQHVSLVVGSVFQFGVFRIN